MTTSWVPLFTTQLLSNKLNKQNTQMIRLTAGYKSVALHLVKIGKNIYVHKFWPFLSVCQLVLDSSVVQFRHSRRNWKCFTPVRIRRLFMTCCRNLLIIIIIILTRVGKNKKNTKKFEVETLVWVVLRGKTAVQQYGFKTLNGNRNALK